jgi:hypothetical protein
MKSSQIFHQTSMVKEAQQNGIPNGGKSVDGVIQNLLNNPTNSSKNLGELNNFSLYFWSTLGIFGVAGILSLVGLGFASKLSRASVNFAKTASTKVKIHKVAIQEQIKKDQLGQSQDNKITPIRSKVDRNEDPGTDPEDGSNKSSAKETKNLTPEQKAIKDRLTQMSNNQAKNNPNCPDSEKIDLDLAEKCGYQKMSAFSMFSMFLKMNHPTTSIPFLNSSEFSKGMMIGMNYLRMMTHLGISTALVAGKPLLQ